MKFEHFASRNPRANYSIASLTGYSPISKILSYSEICFPKKLKTTNYLYVVFRNCSVESEAVSVQRGDWSQLTKERGMKLSDDEEQKKVDEVGLHGEDEEIVRNSETLNHGGHVLVLARRTKKSKPVSPFSLPVSEWLTDWFRDFGSKCQVRKWYVTGISRSPVVDPFCSWWLLGQARPTYDLSGFTREFKWVCLITLPQNIFFIT